MPAGAAVGWRYWRLPAAPALLRSVTMLGVDWRPGHPLVARCGNAGHAAPAEGCACGVYATRGRAALLDHGVCLGPGHVVLGTVALWGSVIDDGDGALRGQYAYPASLDLVVGPGPGGTGPLLDRLGAYGVRVGTVAVADAVGEISARMAAFQAMSR